MTAETLVAVLEQGGVRLIAEGEKLRLQASADKVPNPETIAELRQHKAAVLEYLRGRGAVPEIQFVSLPTPILRKTDKPKNGSELAATGPSEVNSWPPESLGSERRFGQPHAKLFPFIGKRIWTPEGAGILLTAFADGCEIQPDGADRIVRVQPEDVKPIQ